MYAIEFRTKIKNGLIKIPQKYRDRLGIDKAGERVRVIVLADAPELDDKDETDIDMIQQLLSDPLHLPNFEQLSRNEVHGRN